MQDKIKALKGRQAHILGHENMFKSAVLLPIVKKDEEICILFEKRASNLLHQPSEISFPGGRIEKEDNSSKEAAVRETCEELNITADNIEVIAPLDIMVSPFNVIVYPFCGIIHDYGCINPSPDEVAEVFCVPLDYLMNYEPLYNKIYLEPSLPDDYPVDMIPNGKNYAFAKGYLPQVFYVWKDRIIWGLTARILNNFINLIK